MTDGDGIPRMDTSDVQYSRNGIRKLGVRLTPVHDGLSPAPQIEAKPDQQSSRLPLGGAQSSRLPLGGAQSSRLPLGGAQSSHHQGGEALTPALPDHGGAAVIAEEAAFWLLISELEGCDLRVQSEFGALTDAADSTELSLVEVDADLFSPVVTYCDCAPAVAIEQCVLLPAVSDASSIVYNKSSSSRRRIVSGATATGHRLIPLQFKSFFQSLCASRRRLSIYSAYISSVYHSAEFMQPLVLTIIIATHYIVLANKDCAILSICHTGCDPPLRDHYCKPWMSGRETFC